jgi:hypothetical protein
VDQLDLGALPDEARLHVADLHELGEGLLTVVRYLYIKIQEYQMHPAKDGLKAFPLGIYLLYLRVRGNIISTKRNGRQMWAKRSFSINMKFVSPSRGAHRPLCEVAPRESAGPLLGALHHPKRWLSERSILATKYMVLFHPKNRTAVR